jgi:hypothetical protein
VRGGICFKELPDKRSLLFTPHQNKGEKKRRNKDPFPSRIASLGISIHSSYTIGHLQSKDIK